LEESLEEFVSVIVIVLCVMMLAHAWSGTTRKMQTQV